VLSDNEKTAVNGQDLSVDEPTQRRGQKVTCFGDISGDSRPSQRNTQFTDLRTLNILNITYEFTKEALAIEVDRSNDADHTVSVLECIAARTGRRPKFLRMDNGPELTASALRDWCRFVSPGTTYIEPDSPWENPFVESFNGKLRDELLNAEAFETLLEAKVLAEDSVVPQFGKLRHYRGCQDRLQQLSATLVA